MISKAREAELERQRNKILRMRKREKIEFVFVILFCVAVFVVFGVCLFHKCPDTKYHFTIVDKWENERLGSTQYNIKVFVETENADPWQGKAKEMQIKKSRPYFLPKARYRGFMGWQATIFRPIFLIIWHEKKPNKPSSPNSAPCESNAE